MRIFSAQAPSQTDVFQLPFHKGTAPPPIQPFKVIWMLILGAERHFTTLQTFSGFLNTSLNPVPWD